jgi:hypothetical protein
VGSEQWAVGSEQWAVGQWAVGSGQWAVSSRQHVDTSSIVNYLLFHLADSLVGKDLFILHPSAFILALERVWRNGSASASQAEGCGFESRRPLQKLTG